MQCMALDLMDWVLELGIPLMFDPGFGDEWKS